MIINSLLDLDKYKLSMKFFYDHYEPNVEKVYKFINRDKRVFPVGFGEKLKHVVNHELPCLRLTKMERLYLERTFPYYTTEMLTDLENFRFNRNEVEFDDNFGDLTVKITGSTMWETVLMSVISELYFKQKNFNILTREQRRENNRNKLKPLYEAGINVSDFGTRRRYSYDIHKEFLIDAIELANEMGVKPISTSNVHFAMTLGLECSGTVAHELFGLHASLYGYENANNLVMDRWKKLYPNAMKVMLPDTFGSKFFFDHISKSNFCYYDYRQDSGDPKEFVKLVWDTSERFDVTNADVIFSDNLNSSKGIELHKFAQNKGIDSSLGIGTNFSNSCLFDSNPEARPLNMVIKLISANGNPCVKLGDGGTGKYTGDPKEIERCLAATGVK